MIQQKCKTCGAPIRDKAEKKAYGYVFCSQACLDKWNELVIDPDGRFHG